MRWLGLDPLGLVLCAVGGVALATLPLVLVKANRILLKNIAVTGLHWGAHEKKDPKRIPEVFGALFDLYAAEKIRPVIFKSFSLDEVPAALEALGSRASYGKVVITP